jgi:hypothetical protein
MAAWKLPLIVSALALPIVAGFFVGGAGVGVAVGALAVLTILVVAARQRPEGPIVPPPADDDRSHLLLVVTCPLEDPDTVAEVAREVESDRSGGEADVLVLAPARIGFLDRWASDVEAARHAAQQNLVVTVAALAKTGIAAEARVGDEDLLQAIEDQLQSFPATKVVVVSARRDELATDGAAMAALKSRLQVEFRHLAVSG